jgi:hypothetical protein
VVSFGKGCVAEEENSALIEPTAVTKTGKLGPTRLEIPQILQKHACCLFIRVDELISRMCGGCK